MLLHGWHRACRARPTKRTSLVLPRHSRPGISLLWSHVATAAARQAIEWSEFGHTWLQRAHEMAQHA
eukprot:242817-Chlamydomonas_euryale.AAC.3